MIREQTGMRPRSLRKQDTQFQIKANHSTTRNIAAKSGIRTRDAAEQEAAREKSPTGIDTRQGCIKSKLNPLQANRFLAMTGSSTRAL